MNKYELALVLRPDLEEEAKNAEIQKVQDLITRFEGTVDKIDDWGKKRLAYEIAKQKEGYYIVIDFEANPSLIAELERIYRITDNVMKFIVVRKD